MSAFASYLLYGLAAFSILTSAAPTSMHSRATHPANLKSLQITLTNGQHTPAASPLSMH